MPCTTMDIYGHLINEMKEEAAKSMDGLVTPIPVKFPNSIQQKDVS